MRKSLSMTLVTLLVYTLSFSQRTIDAYYKYNWQGTVGRDDASFFSRAILTDSGWYRNDVYLFAGKSAIQMMGLYADKENKIRNGTFRWFYANGRLKQLGRYKQNKKEGTWLEWYSDGSLKDSSTYADGMHKGISLSWYRNGSPKDSLNLDDKGNGIFAAWFDNGNPSEAGRFLNFKKTGKWAYYHINGKISSIETYQEDSLISFQYYDESGKPENKAQQQYVEAKFDGGRRSWNNFFQSSLKFPPNVDIMNSDHITVVVQAVVNEDGSISEVEISVPFHPSFDEEAVTFLKRSPKWVPAMSHNRRVKETITIPIGFSHSYQ